MNINISCVRKMAGVTLAAAIGLSQPAMASGIPVVDIASITQQIMQVQHLLQQIE
jgi:type IV secretion system protein VirB5